MDPTSSTKLTHAVSIQRMPEDLYMVWQDPTQLSAILRHLEGRFEFGEPTDDAQTTPAATFQVTNRVPPELVEWVARFGDEIRYRGVVTFRLAPAGRGTEVRMSMEVVGASNGLAKAIERVRGRDPMFLMREDLRNFKQFMETGEYPTTRGQPSGKRSLTGRALMGFVEDKLQREIERVGERRRGAQAKREAQQGVVQ